MQLEDKQTKNIKMTRETIKRQRLLTHQVMEEIEKLCEETQKDKYEINYLKKKTEQQQQDIAMLTAEKHEQYFLIKQLQSQLESVQDTSKENKNEATQKKYLLQKIHVTTYQEKEALERKYTPNITEQPNLEMVKFGIEQSQDSMEPKEPLEQIKQGQVEIGRLVADSLPSLMNKTMKVIFEAKQAKEEMEKNMADITQEFKKNKQYIIQQRDQIEHIKHSINGNLNRMKQWWTEIEMQNTSVQETGCSRREKEGKGNFYTVKIKLCIIMKEMEKLWDVLEDGNEELEVTLGGSDKEELKTETVQMKSMKPVMDGGIHRIQWETGKKGDEQREKYDIESKLEQVQSEKNEIGRIKAIIQKEREDIKRDRQLAIAEIDMMTRMREDIKKQKQELEDQFEKTRKNIREMEVINSETQMQKKDLAKMIRISKRKKGEMKSGVEYAKQGIELEQAVDRQWSEQVLKLNMEGGFDEQEIRLEQIDRTSEIMQHTENQFAKDNMETRDENKVKSGMQRVILEIEEIKKMLCVVREDPVKNRGAIPRENNQIKLMNFGAKKENQEVAQRDSWRQQKKSMTERNEFQIAKMNIQDRQSDEVEQRLQNIKAIIEKAVAEIIYTRQVMLEAQRMMKDNKEEVKKHMVSSSFSHLNFNFLQLARCLDSQA